jgi:hypothetical protein
MAQEVTFEVGDLYAELHTQYSEQVGEQYEDRLRQDFEEFVHNFNQQVERQREEVAAQQDLDLEADVENE